VLLTAAADLLLESLRGCKADIAGIVRGWMCSCAVLQALFLPGHSKVTANSEKRVIVERTQFGIEHLEQNYQKSVG
jgi:hypothetical protein